MGTMTAPDGITLAVVVFFALRGAVKGFVWQLLRTGGLVLALWLATRHHVAVGRFLADRFSFVPRTGSDIVGWGAVAIGMFVAVTLVAHVARQHVRALRLGGPDRLLGAALGATSVTATNIPIAIAPHPTMSDPVRGT